MKSERQIRKMLKTIKADDRLKGRPATVDINAPLALIQTHLEAQIQILNWVLAGDK